MTTTLIVLAHPEPRSFNGAWAEATRQACLAAGDTVLFSDLVQMGFDPVEAPRHYPTFDNRSNFDPLVVQEAAAERDVLPPDVVSEIERLRRADRVIFHFPIWWFSPPAVLKGWLDRVMSHGAVHDVGNRFDTGHFVGKKALFCVTTGSRASESAYNGKEGDIRMLLWPFAYALRYMGFTVLEPEIVHGVHGYHSGQRQKDMIARLDEVLTSQPKLIEAFGTRSAVPFNADQDFDEDGQLKPDRPSQSRFIRHDP
ncbi:NAD(P)H-dependent oxidoreductase [Histidinibacterium aquaticum]|uniref:NAD(P)H-dependent oxidoreductase n=1 Tax=Histidinibacterium aquaticum TaxID=2613962 RepID=A0A5J5GCQ4_9RHOB|nr:NAD(P)H-dependent oxidoreductase [Histidinibacterium aquaticum]KAA9005748.1 NAD(P)H-dependent oxidoreductase [Histidinibacterium aquaticum]